MTSGQPPQPPLGGEQPEYGRQVPPGRQPSYGQPSHGQPASAAGEPPYGPPPYGQPPYGQPLYGQPPQYGQQPGYASPPYSQPPYGRQYDGPPPGAPPGGGSGFSFDAKKLRMADYVIAGGTLLFFVLALLPWWSYGDELFGYSLSGFDNGSVSSAFLLFLLAAVWTFVPAFAELRLGFPPAWITVGLTGLGFLLTLVAWIDSMTLSFQVWPLLGTLTAAAVLLFAVLSLLPQLTNRPALPGSLAGAAQWANQPAPDHGRPAQPGPEQARPTYARPASPPPPRGAGQLPGTPSAGGSSAPPSAPGGPTAPGDGAGGGDRPTAG